MFRYRPLALVLVQKTSVLTSPSPKQVDPTLHLYRADVGGVRDDAVLFLQCVQTNDETDVRVLATQD